MHPEAVLQAGTSLRGEKEKVSEWTCKGSLRGHEEANRRRVSAAKAQVRARNQTGVKVGTLETSLKTALRERKVDVGAERKATLNGRREGSMCGGTASRNKVGRRTKAGSERERPGADPRPGGAKTCSERAVPRSARKTPNGKQGGMDPGRKEGRIGQDGARLG